MVTSSFTWLCIAFLIWNCSAQFFKITRKPNELKDEFDVPYVRSSDQVSCSKYGASKVIGDDKKCVCNLNNMANSTFGFFDKRWQCFDYNEIRRREGKSTIEFTSNF